MSAQSTANFQNPSTSLEPFFHGLSPVGASTRLRKPRVRSVHEVTDRLDDISRRSPNLLRHPLEALDSSGERCVVPRYMFLGPQGGGETLRIALFAGIHGDEPAGAFALLQLVERLERQSELAAGYCLFLYPVCNPAGFEFDTRHSASGLDLNREFWKDSKEPEVRILEQELRAHAFHGILSLHADDTSEGVYGFVRGATLTHHLIEPALKAAGEVLPINRNGIIDGFEAKNGVILDGYSGILTAPPTQQPKPFELILETPSKAHQSLQEKAFVLSLESILAEYRKLMAFAANL